MKLFLEEWIMPFLFENNRQAIQTIEQNIDITKSPNQFTLLKQNVKHGLKTLTTREEFKPVSLVFIGSTVSSTRNYQ